MNTTVKASIAPPTDGSKAELPHGAYSQIARRVRPQVTAQHVREVHVNGRASKRIQAAIQRFIEQQQERQSA